MKWIALLLLALPATAQDTLTDAARDSFLDRVSKAMKDVTSFAAEFDQEKELKVFRDTVKSRGLIVFGRPDKLRWEIAAPFRSLLVVRADKVAKFEWIDGKRRELKLGRSRDAILIAMQRIRGWFRGEFKQARKDYIVEVTAGKNPRILMTPRDKRLRKTLLRLEFVPSRDLKSMTQVVIREGNGGVTVMRFRGHRHNIKVPKGTFSLTDPADVDVKQLSTAKSHGD